MSTFGEIAVKLAANGYAPIPIRRGEKAPAVSWQRYRFAPQDAGRYARCGVGHPTKHTPCVDIDIRHDALAARLEALARELLGDAPVRIGQAPKRVLLYRTRNPFKKLRTGAFRHEGDTPGAKAHAVEVLGDGQQVVLYGQHPATGRPYEWVGDREPLNIPHAELVEIDERKAAEFIAEADALLAAGPGFVRLSTTADRIERVASEHESGELKARNPDECHEALGAIANDDVDYDAWSRMLCAAKGALGDEGEAAFVAWSAKSSKHREDWTRREFQRCRPERIGAGTIIALARAAGWRPERERIFDPERARVRLDEPLPEPPFIVPGYLPFGTVGGMPAEGGVGKTTYTLFEAVHLVLGLRLFGREVLWPGAVVFLTAEDDRATLAYRLQGVCRAMNFGDADRRRVEDGIFIEDVTGRMLRLVEADDRGNLATTAMGDRLIEAYRERGVALINVDPTNLFGPGERYVNDAEAALMVEGARIAREIGCTVRYVHHVSKAAARDRTVDQYLGRGGAAFADNSRFQHHLVRHEPSASSEHPLPHLADPAENAALQQAVAEGRALRLHTTKLSWAARPIEPVWLIRDGYLFRPVSESRLSGDEMARRRALDVQRRVVEYVRERVAAGVRLSEKQLAEDHFRALGLARNEVRRVVGELVGTGHLRHVELPESERRGQRRTYLGVGPSPLPGDRLPGPEEPF